MGMVAERQDIVVPFFDLGAMLREQRDELDAVWARIVDASTFVGGAEVDRFERGWASACGTRFAVGVGNGTDAIAITLRALGIGHGDEVIVPANTFVATVEAVVLAGATPRFVDVDARTLLVTPESVEAAIGPRTVAVIPVHLYGNVADVEGLCRVAARAGIVVIEDAAQAHGAAHAGRHAGSFGTAGTFSFYPGKNLGAFGDGGAIVTDDPWLAGRIRSIADHGRAEAQRYLHPLVGTNSRLDGLQAAILSTRLRALPRWNAARAAIAGAYARHLPRGIELVQAGPMVRSSWHLAVIQVEDRARVRRRLAHSGVETGIHYPVPCHQQEAYLQWSPGRLPVAEAAAERVVSLPMFPHMREEQVVAVCRALERALAGVPDRVPG
jgi:dTDP-4-amino-4,6-dideoxygalactose transaminase